MRHREEERGDWSTHIHDKQRQTNNNALGSWHAVVAEGPHGEVSHGGLHRVVQQGDAAHLGHVVLFNVRVCV